MVNIPFYHFAISPLLRPNSPFYHFNQYQKVTAVWGPDKKKHNTGSKQTNYINICTPGGKLGLISLRAKIPWVILAGLLKFLNQNLYFSDEV